MRLAALVLALFLGGGEMDCSCSVCAEPYKEDRLSRNFTRDEFACLGHGCCGHSAPISPVLIAALQSLRDKVGPLTINSGFRCLTHNREIGSTDTSQHPLGLAADVHLPDNLHIGQFQPIAESIDAFTGIGAYSWGLHLDVRNGDRVTW